MPRGNGGKKNEWPAAWTERMMAMRLAGRSGTEMAKALNHEFGAGLTRSAVLGKIARLGMPKLDAAVAGTNHQRGLARFNAGKPRKPKAAPRPKKVAAPKLRIYRDFCGPPAPPPSVANMKLIHLAGYGECRWPAYTSAEGHLFCCAPVFGKSSYCREHAAASVGKSVKPYRFSSDHASAQAGAPWLSEAA